MTNAVGFFATQPSCQFGGKIIDGLSYCQSKKLVSSEKIALLALSILLGIAVIVSFSVPQSTIIPLGLCVAVVCSLAYTVYRFYQNRITWRERALQSLFHHDYRVASNIFASMLKPEYTSFTLAKFHKHNREREAKHLPKLLIFNLLRPAYVNNFEISHIRSKHSHEIFGYLYGTTLLYKLHQDLQADSQIKLNDVKERIEQAKFWIGWTSYHVSPWQEAFANTLLTAATNKIKPGKAPLHPSPHAFGALALLFSIERLYKGQFGAWLGYGHTFKYLQSLKSFIYLTQLPAPALKLYQDLLKCKNLEEMKAATSSFPQSQIDQLISIIQK